jgi:enoyl-CoA hydratase/carnithine racemase
VQDQLAVGDELGWRVTDDAKAVIRASEDAAEGVRSFLEKRPPVWQAR